MALTELSIANMALSRMGQAHIDDIDGTDAVEVKINAVFDQVRDELLTAGPWNGWRFARHTYHQIKRESFAITAFALATATTTTVTATHTLVAGDLVEITGTTNYNGTYEVLSVSTTVSFVIDTAYIANDATGTAYWTGEHFYYRYAVPTCKSIRCVSVGNVELPDWERIGDYIYTNEEDTEVDMDIIKVVTDVTKFPDHFVRVFVLKLAIEMHYNLTQDLKAIQMLSYELENAMSKAIAMEERQKYVKEYSSSWVDIGHNTDEIE